MFVLPVSRRSASFSRHVDHMLHGAVDAYLRPYGRDVDDAVRSPAIDVSETDAAYIVTLDMPGVAKEDVQVSVEGRRLTVQATVRVLVDEAKPAAGEMLYRERSTARYERTVSLPKAVDQATAVAKLEHGVLVLTLPKPVATQPARIVVN